MQLNLLKNFLIYDHCLTRGILPHIVENIGLDLQTDGGTRIANIKEVGGLQVLEIQFSDKENKHFETVIIDDLDIPTRSGWQIRSEHP